MADEHEEKYKGANHEAATLKNVLIKCNYKWDPKLKHITDFHGGQSLRSNLGAEYETVQPKIKLDQHLLE